MEIRSSSDFSIPYRTLVALEVGSIQRYITETSRLREIRGASALVAEINRIYVPEIVNGKDLSGQVGIVRSSGGVTLLGVRHKAPDDCEQRLTNALLACYHTRLPGAAVYATPPVPCTNATSVKALLNRISYETARQQGATPAPDAEALPMEPLIRYCDSCGLRAVQHARTIGDDSDLICRVCYEKSERGRQIRGDDESYLAQFKNFVKDRAAWQRVGILKALPLDLSALAATGPSKDLALILADGNRLGQTLREFTSLEQYEEFSKEVARIVEEAVFEALALHTPRPVGKENKQTLPWEIVFIGGDDVLLITAADIALPVAHDLMRHVEAETAPLFQKLGLKRKKLSMAAGVAIAAAHYPFRALYSLAGQLESSAKKRAYEEDVRGIEASTLDFHRLTASGRSTLWHIRNVELRPRRSLAKEREIVSLTKRPYTLDELKDVLDLADAWQQDEPKKLPRHKIHYLREQLFESAAEAMFAWAHVVGRAGPDERALWRRLDALSIVSDVAPDYQMPWTVTKPDDPQKPPRRATYLLDVIDLLALQSNKENKARTE